MQQAGEQNAEQNKIKLKLILRVEHELVEVIKFPLF